MNIYQHLVSMGLMPDQCVSENSVTVFKANDGSLGLGFYETMVICRGRPEDYKRAYRTKMEVEMLGVTPQHLLGIVEEIHRLAAEKGIEVKGEDCL